MAKRVLMVRSGGGLDGIDIHLGVWEALWHGGVQATELSGTSAGALVCALEALGMTPAEACREIARLGDADVRDPRTAWRLRMAWVDSIWRGERARSLLDRLLPASWDLYATPCSTWATRMADVGRANTWSASLAETPAQAVYASMAIPGVLPPAMLMDGQAYVDGGLRANLPASPAYGDWDEMWVVVATGPRRSYAPPRGLMSAALNAFGMLIDDQTLDVWDDLSACVWPGCGGAGRIRLLWPEIGKRRGMLRWNHSLIDEAYEWTNRELERMEREDAARAKGDAA